MAKRSSRWNLRRNDLSERRVVRIRPDSVELLDAGISQWPRQQQWRTGPQLDGPSHGQRRRRHHSRPPGQRRFGNRPNGIYVPRFRNIKTKRRFSAWLWLSRRGLARRLVPRHHATGLWRRFQKRASKPGPGIDRLASANAFQSPTISSRSTGGKSTRWGIPTLQIHCLR